MCKYGIKTRLIHTQRAGKYKTYTTHAVVYGLLSTSTFIVRVALVMCYNKIKVSVVCPFFYTVWYTIEHNDYLSSGAFYIISQMGYDTDKKRLHCSFQRKKQSEIIGHITLFDKSGVDQPGLQECVTEDHDIHTPVIILITTSY